MMIRQVTDKDESRVIQLLQQLWPDKRIAPEETRRVIEEYVNESDYRIHVCEEEGIILGIITPTVRWAFYCDGKVATIEDLILDEVDRAKGIGGKLVRFAEDRITEDSEVKAVELNSGFDRKAAHGFWEECGYSKPAFQFRKEAQSKLA